MTWLKLHQSANHRELRLNMNWVMSYWASGPLTYVILGGPLSGGGEQPAYFVTETPAEIDAMLGLGEAE